jgi:1,4-dihydroxy-6-naphthoate synthase
MQKTNPTLRLGYSPCPNDTFIFFGLAEGKVDVSPYRLDITLADVEALNRKARNQELEVSKVSMSAVLHLLDDYWLLRSGGALGRGCGPLVVAREPLTMEELAEKAIAIPGKMTTANLLLRLCGTHRGPSVEMPFDQIMGAVADGEVEAGVIIHESRFTYPALGLRLVVDLGEFWELKTGLPLPLGGIVMKRSLGPDAARFVEAKIRASLLYTRSRPEEAWPYIRSHAQEMDSHVMQQHIDMFVNDFSLDIGGQGERAVRFLLEAAAREENTSLGDKPLFWE